VLKLAGDRDESVCHGAQRRCLALAQRAGDDADGVDELDDGAAIEEHRHEEAARHPDRRRQHERACLVVAAARWILRRRALRRLVR